jgi:hypothetical protein
MIMYTDAVTWTAEVPPPPMVKMASDTALLTAVEAPLTTVAIYTSDSAELATGENGALGTKIIRLKIDLGVHNGEYVLKIGVLD